MDIKIGATEQTILDFMRAQDNLLGEKLAAVYPQGLLFEIVKKVNLTLIIRLLILTPFVIFVLR